MVVDRPRLTEGVTVAGAVVVDVDKPPNTGSAAAEVELVVVEALVVVVEAPKLSPPLEAEGNENPPKEGVVVVGAEVVLPKLKEGVIVAVAVLDEDKPPGTA